MYIPQNRFASVKTLQTFLNVSKETAKQIRKLVKGEIHPNDCPCRLSDKEFAGLSRVQKTLWVINDLLDQHGVESFDNGCSDPRYFVAASYVNNGRTYQPTIFYHEGEYKVASQGDIITRYGF